MCWVIVGLWSQTKFNFLKSESLGKWGGGGGKKATDSFEDIPMSVDETDDQCMKTIAFNSVFSPVNF